MYQSIRLETDNLGSFYASTASIFLKMFVYLKKKKKVCSKMLTLSTDFIILCVFYFRPQFHLYSVLFVFIWFLKKIPIKPIFIISDYVFAPDFAFVLDMCKCEYT